MYMSSGQNYMLNLMPVGSSPIGYEGLMQPRKGQGASKTKLVLQ